MSLPRDLLDQLLTGYLDDTLSADELTRVQQLLDTDEDFASQLAEYQQIRAALKSSSNADIDVRLPAGFANQVLDAAVSRARDEGLADDHPLLRLAEQPSSLPLNRPLGTRGVYWQAGILVGLAASIAIAVVVLRPKSNPPGVEGLAAIESPMTQDTTTPALDARAADSIDDGPAVAALDTTPETVAVAEPVAEPVVTETSPSSVEIAADVEAERSTNEIAIDAVATNEITPEMEADAAPQIATAATVADEKALTRLQPVIVFDVRLTDIGKANDTIGEALRHASLGAATQKNVSDDVANFTRQQVADNDVSASTVLYLQAPARSIDRFYLRLLSQPESVKSVGMSLAEAAPVKRIVNSVKPDPTDVRHPDVSLELSSENGMIDDLARELGQLPFLPLDKEAGVIPSLGADVKSQVLVLIR